jgi:Mn2+/Fe2+ NRAMP family transporter
MDKEQKLEADKQALIDARGQGPVATFFTFMKLSGPGWLQSAITLGGGSLGSSLYLGVLAGFGLLWLQPVAMILGIIMLSAIGYVTMSTGERPFKAINEHINPVLGWGWALASLLANMVWALPQYSLATGVIEQNLLPGIFGADAPLAGNMGKTIIVSVILIFCTVVTWSYGRGSRGVKIYEMVLKIMVALIVLCFVGVAFKITVSPEGLAWGEMLKGFIPDPRTIVEPAAAFIPLLDAVPEAARAFWMDRIVSEQRDVLLAAAATAVGINMTFLFPYTLLSRGWGKEFRSFSRFDLATGMFFPFVLATSCVIVAAASQFHATPKEDLVAFVNGSESLESSSSAYAKALTAKLASEFSDPAEFQALAKDETALLASLNAMPESEKMIAASLVKRDAFDLAKALRPLTGATFGNVIFGLGVLGMTLSTITLLMLISGFVICEMLNLPPEGKAHQIGCLAAATGVLGPFIWSEAAFYLVVPTSVFGLMLLPIAYLSFFLMMNQKSLMKDEMPKGRALISWNILMGLATLIAGAASIWGVVTKAGTKGIIAYGIFIGLALVVHFKRQAARKRAA